MVTVLQAIATCIILEVGLILGILFGKKIIGPIIFGISAIIQLLLLIYAQNQVNSIRNGVPINTVMLWIVFAVLIVVGIGGIIARKVLGKGKKSGKKKPDTNAVPIQYGQQDPNIGMAWGQPQPQPQPQPMQDYPSMQDIYGQSNYDVNTAGNQLQQRLSQPNRYEEQPQMWNQPVQQNQPHQSPSQSNRYEEQPQMWNQPVQQDQPHQSSSQPNRYEEQPQMWNQPVQQDQPHQSPSQSNRYDDQLQRENQPAQPDQPLMDMNSYDDDEIEEEDAMYMTSPVLNTGRDLQRTGVNESSPIQPAKIKVRWDDVYPAANIRPLPEWQIAKVGVHIVSGKFYRVDSRNIKGKVEDEGREISLAEFHELTNNRFPEITEQNSLSYLPKGKRR